MEEPERLGQEPEEFYRRHQEATVLVVDKTTGLPVSAEYRYALGRERETPAVYWFPEY
jgi:hypothetical protein